MNTFKRGFTIVELLVVIVVIAILASITAVAYGTIQDRARVSKGRTDMRNMEQSIKLAQSQSGKVLRQITGSWATKGSCMQNSTTVRSNLNTLPKTDPCWTDYIAAITAIEAAAGTSLTGLKQGSPWGGPYLIDENEGEDNYAKSPCQPDYIGANDGTTGRLGKSLPLARPDCVEGDSAYLIPYT